MVGSPLSMLLRIVLYPLRRLVRSAHPPSAPTPPAQSAAPADASVQGTAVGAPLQGAAPADARTRSGKYDAPLLKLVTAQPGITVAQAADQIGIPATGLYPTIRRLQSQGKLAKVGRTLQPIDG